MLIGTYKKKYSKEKNHLVFILLHSLQLITVAQSCLAKQTVNCSDPLLLRLFILTTLLPIFIIYTCNGQSYIKMFQLHFVWTFPMTSCAMHIDPVGFLFVGSFSRNRTYVRLSSLKRSENLERSMPTIGTCAQIQH